MKTDNLENMLLDAIQSRNLEASKNLIDKGADAASLLRDACRIGGNSSVKFLTEDLKVWCQVALEYAYNTNKSLFYYLLKSPLNHKNWEFTNGMTNNHFL